jgi:diguanylate cyclase (GGDEF)-like protein
MENSSILIIDDDHNLGKTLSDILSSKNYTTFSATTGSEGLSILEHHTFSVALIDLNLPDVSGIDVLERIKTKSPSTEAIILTANASLSSAIEATNRGAFSYLLKPYEIEQLLLTISHAIEKVESEKKIINQKQVLETKNRDLRALYEVSLAINRSIVLEELLSGVLQALAELKTFHLERKGAAFIFRGNSLQLVSHIGLSEAQLDLCSSAANMDCLCGLTAKTGEIVVCRNSHEDPRHTIRYPAMPIHADIHLPLKTLDKVVGVISLFMNPEAELDQSDVMLLTTLANQIGTAVSNAQLYEEAKTVSLHDHLTGLPNRRFMQIQLEKCLKTAKRYGESLSVIMLDIDHFKRFNDTRGHVQGDRLLVQLSEIISNALRCADFVFRYGGEEFLILLPRTQLISASDVAERLRMLVEKETEVTVSLGVTAFQGESGDCESLINSADKALYRAKGEGRNRVVIDP